MDQAYLQQLISEVNARSGGLVLNMNGKPEAVVLSIEKYNSLVQNSEFRMQNENPIAMPLQQVLNSKTVLVTGGAGYIGAHVARQLINAGHSVVVIDNLSSGIRENVPSEAVFIEGDISDINLLRDIFSVYKIDVVMHLAASIEVEESVREPAKYLENNAVNTAKLLSAMDEVNVKNIIFSSTAAAYGFQTLQPIPETAESLPDNPYGHSKLIAEEIIKYYGEHKGFNTIVFRYFNACGSDFDGQIKATHESHLLAKIMLVLKGLVPQLVVHGSDYQTHDGTGVRDYVHVLDIAEAHLLAMGRIGERPGFNLYNIGTGRGASVLEIVNAATENLNLMIPMQMGPRRDGDAPMSVADASKILNDLGFTPKFSDLETIIKTAYKQSQN